LAEPFRKEIAPSAETVDQKGMGMRVAVIVHGPEAVDSGLAARVLEKASALGHVRAVVGGTTAVAAVIDAGLEGRIDISERTLPSEAIGREVHRSDLVLLVNQGKDRGSSLAFGRLVMSKVDPGQVPVVQVEEGLSIIWSGDKDALQRAGPFLDGEMLDQRGMAVPAASEGARTISGVRPGENIWVNGHVIGRAEGTEVSLSQPPDGTLLAKGVRLKPTGIQRLGGFDLRTAIVRSGQIRRTTAQPRSLPAGGKAVYLIDHCAERVLFLCRDAAYVVTVGDDTSKIASSLLYRLGIPILAITDGDEDGISDERLLYPGSHVFRLVPGTDDLVGAEIASSYFEEGRGSSAPAKIEEMASIIRAACGEWLLWEERS